MRKCLDRNVFAPRQYQCLIIISFCHQFSLVGFSIFQLQVRNIIEGVTLCQHKICSGFKGCTIECRADRIEMFKHSLAVICIPVKDWEIQKYLIVRPSCLKKRLNPGNVIIKSAKVIPDRVNRCQFNSGIE